MIARWLLDRLPKKDVGNGKGDVFFWRYTLLKTRWFALYLHEFLRSDRERCLHNHPWAFTTLILRDGYWEELPSGRSWRPPGYIHRYPASHFHRIELDPSHPRPWSLVLVGRKSQSWGFRTPRGFVPWTPGYSPICEE